MCAQARLEPDYFESFHCKCGACRHTCCNGWEVDVSMKDYFRLIGLDCSEKLHRRIETAFAEPDEKSEISFKKLAPDWFGKCPFLSAEGLCSLQLECGAEVLPEVCRSYPRSLKKTNGLLYACCSGSCEAVLELLEREAPLTFTVHETQEPPEMTETAPDDLLPRRLEAIGQMQDRSLPIDERVLRVCRMLCPDFVPPTDESLLTDLPLYAEESDAYRPYADAAERYRRQPEQLAEDLHTLRRQFPAIDCWLENWLVNHLLYADFPFTDRRIAESDSVYGQYTAYRLLLLTCACAAADGADTSGLTDAVAALFHLLEHTFFYYNAFVLEHKRG